MLIRNNEGCFNNGQLCENHPIRMFDNYSLSEIGSTWKNLKIGYIDRRLVLGFTNSQGL